MIYKGIDRWSSPDYLEHYKYVKKIKIGGHTRYFYSLKDLQAYYNEQKTRRNESDNIARGELADVGEYINTSSEFSKQQKSLMNKETAKARKGLNRKSKMNSLNAALDTGKFAMRNALGGESKEKMRKQYKKSSAKDYKKYYNDRSDWAEDYADKVNSIGEGNIAGVKKRPKKTIGQKVDKAISDYQKFTSDNRKKAGKAIDSAAKKYQKFTSDNRKKAGKAIDSAAKKYQKFTSDNRKKAGKAIDSAAKKHEKFTKKNRSKAEKLVKRILNR